MSDLGALKNIKHIVVLMLENRSFDHMLGYLALDSTYGFEIDGLKRSMGNTYEGQQYPVHALPGTSMLSWETPSHEGPNVAAQLANDGGGFVSDFVTTRPASVRALAANPATCCVTGYHTGDQLYAYDHLARTYAVCDRWFSSVPGATMPNRLYSVCGTSGGIKSNQKVNGHDFPLYSLPSFVRQIDGHVSWRWYRHDALIPSTLSMFDPKYRTGHNSNFSLYQDFATHCRQGKLANVSWIEPGFFDKFGLHQTDDHPPTDVSVGQRLVTDVCNAVMSAPTWDSTMLVITYDEHGGFYDHVKPPPAEDDDPRMRQYGVRVPGFVVSPYSVPGVCHTLFDHTSILRTILDRFREGLDPGVMGARVAAANNLASTLGPTAAPPDPIPAAAVPPAGHAGAPAGGPAAAPMAPAAPGSADEIADLVASASDGRDLGPRLRDYVESNPPAGRPLDDLQEGLLVAAAELSHLEKGAGPTPRDLRRSGVQR